jgi:hypothetical protein
MPARLRRAEVQRVLGGPGFFTADGRLKPFSQLNSHQQDVFSAWISQNKSVLAATGKQQEAAQLRYASVPC